MKKRTGLFVALMLTGPLAWSAEPLVGCSNSTVPIKYRKPIEDLGGNLPVADYLDAVLDCAQPGTPGALMVGGRPAPRPQSAWVEGEMQRYGQVLARSHFDWLVLPAQTQYLGFDRIERQLIGAEVASAVGANAAPDVLLVSRALGEPRRRFEFTDVSRLAKDLGARHLVEVYAGHDGDRHLTLTLLLKDCDAAGACRLVKQQDWRGLPFSDTQLPFLVVHGLANQIRAALPGLPAPVALASKPLRTDKLFDGVSPAALAAPKFESNAAVLGWLASLAPADNPLGTERLQVLALRAALAADGSPTARVLAAHAAMRLYRRPYALSLLQGVQDPAADMLRELLNGNGPESVRAAAAVKSPLLRLMFSIDTVRLSTSYNHKLSLDGTMPAAVFGAAAKDWHPFIDRRIHDADPWGPSNPVDIKRQLDATFPIEKLSLAAIMRGASAIGDEDIANLDVANIRHVRATLEKLDAARCCAGSGGSAWPLYWFLDALTDAHVFHEFNRLVNLQDNYKRGVAFGSQFDAFYAGHTRFEQIRGEAIAGLIGIAPPDEAARLRLSYDKSDDTVAYWAQGQDPDANDAVNRGTPRLPYAEAYSNDFPLRPFWSVSWMEGFAQRHACTQLAYSIDSANMLKSCVDSTPAAQQAQLRSDVQARFHGNAEIQNFFAQPAPGAPPDRDAILARARQRVAEDPNDAGAYESLARAQLDLFDLAEEAQKAFLSWPELKAKRHDNPVGLSNTTYDWGTQLMSRGRTDLALPLFRYAADLDTGSAASLLGAMRVALAEGDYVAAAQSELERASRYHQTDAYANYLSLLHLMGNHADAHAAFRQIADRYDGPEIWHAEMVGQRMEAVGYDQMKSWVLGDEIRKAHYYGQYFAPYYALRWIKTDRAVPKDFPAFMDQVERDAVRIIDGGLVMHPHPITDEGMAIEQPSKFRAGKTAPLPDGARVKSEYVLMADAFAALDAANYPAAVEKFAALADRYQIEFPPEYSSVAFAYLALAAAKSGDTLHFEQYMETLPDPDSNYDVQLSRAFFAAARRDVPKAQDALNRAFRLRENLFVRPISTAYQYLDACEIVARETGDARFTHMAVAWAKNWQMVEPWTAWGYTVEAQYSTVPADAKRALALSLYLDPESTRLARIDAHRKAEAREWLRDHNPFVPKVAVKPSSAGT